MTIQLENPVAYSESKFRDYVRNNGPDIYRILDFNFKVIGADASMDDIYLFRPDIYHDYVKHSDLPMIRESGNPRFIGNYSQLGRNDLIIEVYPPDLSESSGVIHICKYNEYADGYMPVWNEVRVLDSPNFLELLIGALE